jgi:hypothetical protein
MSPIRRLLLSFLIAPLCAGCYAYLPTPNGRPSAGAEVLLTLSDSGTVAMTPFVGPSVGVLMGRVVADSADAYLLNVTGTARRDGIETDWRGERVVVSRVLVTTVSTRRFSPGRTVLFSAVTGGALAAVIQAFVGGGGASSPGGTPTGGPVGK